MKSTDRYEILERLGGGGMGVVYRAYDRRRKEEVALKTLLNASPSAIYRFKEEFRALAGVVHPNLVALYELETLKGSWFLTMELIHGLDLLAHVRRTTRRIDAYAETASLQSLPASAAFAPLAQQTLPLDDTRLREALLQLAHGIHALHGAGKLHCDIKPSNVMVSDAGRVVVLDFGLVTEVDPGPFAARFPTEVIGTVAYMAPEQILNSELTPAVDWYAFGVLLYEALTGELPYIGKLREVIMAKQLLDALPPVEILATAPQDLSDLAVALLHRDPALRPGAAEIIARLGANAAPPSFSARRAAQGVFVGRVTELASLSRAFEARQRGRAVTVLLSGASGIGKSTLARRFLEAQKARGPLLVLEGRCYERESVPYKALDSVIDRLSQHLLRLRHDDAVALMPPDIDLLTHIFPVLRQVNAAAPTTKRPRTQAQEPAVPDPQEYRRRAFAALRELLRRLTDTAPLVLLIDDLQWGDADSAALLEAVLLPPSPPPILLIACFREDGSTKNPLLRALQERWGSSTERHDVYNIALPPLSLAETRALSTALLAEEEDAAPELAERIAREAAGSPLFAQELLRHARRQGGDLSAAVRLEDVVRARVAMLDDEQRRLLELLAIAGHPIAELTAIAATSGAAQGRRAIAGLCALHLVRGHGTDDAILLEPYHDRIRQTVAGGLSAEAQKAHHLALAEALRALPDADPELLVEHYREAGAPERAASFAVLAAERAASALAFSRAASLYRLALSTRPLPAKPWLLREQLGRALANAGKGREAAAAFAEAATELAASSPKHDGVLELKRRAGEQYLRSGHIDEGLALLREVLAEVGAFFPDTPVTTLAALLLDRARLRARGPLKVKLRPADAISSQDRVKLEAYWSASIGLSMVDSIRAAYFQTRHELMALDLGEPINVARGLGSQVATMASVGGAANRQRCAEVLALAEGLAERVADPSIVMLTHFCAATAAYFEGAWARTVARCGQARRIGRERCVGVTWEMDSLDLLELWSVAYLGDFPDLVRRLPVLLKEARERDDVFAETSLRLGLPNMAWLAQDRPDEAEAQATQAMRSWTSVGVHSQHYFELVARVQAALYRGDALLALQRVEATWPRLKAALLLRLQSIRIELHHLRGRATIAALVALPDASRERRRLLHQAEQDEALIAAEDMAWSAPLAALIGAGVAAERGFVGAAIAALDRAASDLSTLDMALYAAAARLQRGHLRGEDGLAEREESLAWMERQGIARPARMAAMLVPIRGGVT